MQMLAGLILNWLWGKIYSFVADLLKKARRNKEIDHESDESVKPLKDAKTGEEIDKASDDALSGF